MARKARRNEALRPVTALLPSHKADHSQQRRGGPLSVAFCAGHVVPQDTSGGSPRLPAVAGQAPEAPPQAPGVVSWQRFQRFCGRPDSCCG